MSEIVGASLGSPEKEHKLRQQDDFGASAVKRVEMSKEEILDSIERGLLEALAGQSRPALEFLDELDSE